MKTFTNAILALCLVIPLTLQASWAAISLEDFVKGRPLIVMGEVQRIAVGAKSPRSYDTAFIKVERILKSSLKDNVPKVGAEIPLSMPSTNSEMKMSTDLFYKKGQRGIWILQHQDGKFQTGHPMALQPISEESKILAVINGTKK